MAKALVVIDMPKSCWDCPVSDGEYGRCQLLDKEIWDIDDERLKGCPLRPYKNSIPIVKLLKNIAVKLNEIEQLTPTWLSQLELGMLEKCDIDFAEGYKKALSDIIDIIKRYDHEKDI